MPKGICKSEQSNELRSQFKSLGWMVFRVSNERIQNNIATVVQNIKELL